MTWLIVLALGATGAVIRAVAVHRLPPLVGLAAVNIGAAFLIGLLSTRDGALGTGVQIGLLGAASTWSSLAHQIAELLRAGERLRATAYLTATLVAGIGAAWIGLRMG